MKKTWLLMCLMVLLLLPATAMAVCGHNNLTDPGVAGIRDKYVPYSSTQHERQTSFKFVCLTCGDSFWMDWSREWFPHEFTGNKCTVCGYTKGGSGGGSSTSCNHNDASYHVSTLIGSPTYYRIYNGHIVTCHYKITCRVCGKVIESDYVGRTEEEHTYNASGQCTKCDFGAAASPSSSQTNSQKTVIRENMTVESYVIKVYSDGTCEITDYKGHATQLNIPEKLGGYRVTAIGKSAFVITALRSVYIPSSVTMVGDNAFSNNKYLTQIMVSSNHPTLQVVDGVLFDTVEKRLICYPMAFTDKQYSIPEGTLTIGMGAFYGSTLTSVTIADTVKEIRHSAFAFCNSLKSIYIPRSVTRIEAHAFNFCDYLTTVNVPSTCTVEQLAFNGCYSLTIKYY